MLSREVDVRDEKSEESEDRFAKKESKKIQIVLNLESPAILDFNEKFKKYEESLEKQGIQTITAEKDAQTAKENAQKEQELQRAIDKQKKESDRIQKQIEKRKLNEAKQLEDQRLTELAKNGAENGQNLSPAQQ